MTEQRAAVTPHYGMGLTCLLKDFPVGSQSGSPTLSLYKTDTRFKREAENRGWKIKAEIKTYGTNANRRQRVCNQENKAGFKPGAKDIKRIQRGIKWPLNIWKNI